MVAQRSGGVGERRLAFAKSNMHVITRDQRRVRVQFSL